MLRAMNDPALSIDRILLLPPPAGENEHVVVNRPLHRIMAFAGYSIDDIVDDTIARNAVFGYYKLYKLVLRRYEIIDLERQWNNG